MCWCDPKVSRDFCGRPGCHWPTNGNRHGTVQVTRKEPDPRGFSRVNSGGRPDAGFYVIFRGTLQQAIKTTRHVLAALESLEGGVATICDRCGHR